MRRGAARDQRRDLSVGSATYTRTRTPGGFIDFRPEGSSVVMEQITPHVHPEQGSSSYAKLVPGISRNAPVSDVIWVNNFRADDARLMMRTIEQIVGAMTEAEGQPRGFWYEVQGGDAASADYFVVTPFENFAALDDTRAGVWDVVAKVRGEAESERLRADFRTSLDSSWAYLFRRTPELSHNP